MCDPEDTQRFPRHGQAQLRSAHLLALLVPQETLQWWGDLSPTSAFHLSADLSEFRKIFSGAKKIAILTGAGVSAESGVPTFRGPGGYWRKWQAQVPSSSSLSSLYGRSSRWRRRRCLATSLPGFLLGLFPAFFSVLQSLATPEAFSRNPSRVWEFYHYRREVMLTKQPNPAHLAIAECEERLGRRGRQVTVITQNIDELHRRAGSRSILELHGK